MKSRTGRSKPLARTEGLIVKDLAEEVLVYDRDCDQAHCLNETAAFVWRHCDGKTTPKGIAELLGHEKRTKIDEDVVWLALDQLQTNDLLSRSTVRPAAFGALNRREVVRALGLAAIVAVPVVTSIVAPTAAQAATCLAPGSPCTSGPQCCTGVCNTSGTSCAQPTGTCC